MLTTRTKLILASVLMVAVWEIGPRVLKLHPLSGAKKPVFKSERDEVFAVVQTYVESANKGDYKKLLDITCPIPKGARIESQEQTASQPGVVGVASPERVDQASLHEIRSRFPETLANTREKIFNVPRLLLKDGFAKVSVIFETEQLIVNIPWIFMLARNPDGQWRIYEITSEYEAVKYLPVETQEP